MPDRTKHRVAWHQAQNFIRDWLGIKEEEDMPKKIGKTKRHWEFIGEPVKQAYYHSDFRTKSFVRDSRGHDEYHRLRPFWDIVMDDRDLSRVNVYQHVVQRRKKPFSRGPLAGMNAEDVTAKIMSARNHMETVRQGRLSRSSRIDPFCGRMQDRLDENLARKFLEAYKSSEIPYTTGGESVINVQVWDGPPVATGDTHHEPPKSYENRVNPTPYSQHYFRIPRCWYRKVYKPGLYHLGGFLILDVEHLERDESLGADVYHVIYVKRGVGYKISHESGILTIDDSGLSGMTGRSIKYSKERVRKERAGQLSEMVSKIPQI